MSDARKIVEKMIATRQGKNTAYRNQVAKTMGPNNIVLEFIDAIEKASISCKDTIEFDEALNQNAKLLEDRMRRLDNGVRLEVVWNHASKDEHWKDLAVDGVKIIWSESYLLHHPEVNKELTIDVSSLFLDGTIN